MIDLHVHILPGVDDGPRDSATAVEMCRIAVRDGITKIAATPHFLARGAKATREEISTHVDSLKATLREKQVPLEIVTGAEVRLVEDLPERIHRGEIPMIGESRYLLLEAPLEGDFSAALRQMTFDLRLAGITPIIAHIERLGTLAAHPDLPQDLALQGAVLQVNASSLSAAGTPVFARANRMLETGLVHVVASDAHDATRRPPRLAEARRRCVERLGEKAADLLFRGNPEAILANRPVEPVPPPHTRTRGRPVQTTLARFTRKLEAWGRSRL